MSSGILQLPCLGKIFHLGMLYDCRSETIIPGKSLWDSTVLKSHMQRRAQPYSNFEIVAEDTLNKKSFNLGINADLKLSFMGGMVEISGAANYLDDRKSSDQQARVALKYTSTTHLEELTMEQIHSIQYPEVFEDTDATHVVSAVLYGSDAFFVFDREVSTDESVRDIEGNMKALVKALPGISKISGDAAVNLKEKDKKKVEKFSCKFYGDLILQSNPSTFEDAVKVYRDLPKLLNDKTSIPKLVYLYPLAKLDGRKQQIIRSISSSLVAKAEEAMEALHNMEVKANDLKKHDTCTKFPDTEYQLSSFLSLLEQFRIILAKKISDLLPKIRGRGAEEKELAGLIGDIKKSPFSPARMATYIRDKGKEIKLLTQYLKNMRGQPKIVDAFPTSENDIITMTTSDEYEFVVCFAFNVTTKESPYLKNLEEYIQQGDLAQHEKEWYEKKEVLKIVKQKSNQFVKFVAANSDRQNIAFAIADCNEDIAGPGIIAYVDGLANEDLEFPEKPGTPTSKIISHDTVQLSWKMPEQGAQYFESFNVLCISNEHSELLHVNTADGRVPNFYIIKKLAPSTKFSFKVQAVTKVGVSEFSDSCSIKTRPCPVITRPAKRIINFCEVTTSGSPTIYMLPLTKIIDHANIGLFKYDIGMPITQKSSAERLTVKEEKVLLVVGATGAGKSTLINGLVNHVLGVQWNDGFRFKVIADAGESSMSHAHSQTQHITAYTFHDTTLPYTLTIVDTPGFGDTGGIEKDKEIAKMIKDFFSLSGCIDHLNGVGFVTQASLERLTPTQKYIFDAVLSKFGKDIKENIFLMTTFADADDPPVLKAVEESDIYYKDYFKFNNSAVFASNIDKGKFNSMFWEMGRQSFHDFFNDFSLATAKSLTLTREVLTEREHLETLIPGLQQQVKVGMDKLSEIEQEQRILKQHEEDIKANKNFEYEVEIHKHEKVPLDGVCTTNCLKCCFTCHERCIYSDDSDKVNCSSMSGEYCTVCPDKCHWTEHSNTPYYYKYFNEMIKVKRTHENLKERYLSAQSEKNKLENMISSSEIILTQLQVQVLKLIDRARKSKKRLEEIALKPNPLSEVEYLDLLIATEEEEHKPGWGGRVQMYRKLREEAEILKKLPNEMTTTTDPKNKGWWSWWPSNLK